jgi:hypothetical protein
MRQCVQRSAIAASITRSCAAIASTTGGFSAACATGMREGRILTRDVSLRRSGHAGANEPTPVRMPSGNRIRSFVTKEAGERPAVDKRRLTWIIAKEAARQTSNVVRSPTALPCWVRLSPIGSPAMTARTSRNSAQPFPARALWPAGQGRPGLRDRFTAANLLTAGAGTATLDAGADGRPSARTDDPPTKAGGLFLAAQAARAATTRRPRVPRRALARSSPGA